MSAYVFLKHSLAEAFRRTANPDHRFVVDLQNIKQTVALGACARWHQP